MPLPSYTWVHAAARFTDKERQQPQWSAQEAERLQPGPK
jgi:hypothetical protein